MGKRTGSVKQTDLRSPDEMLAMSPTKYDVEWWSRTPVVVTCAWPACTVSADEERVLCEKHFFSLLSVVKRRGSDDIQIREGLPNAVVYGI